jgi:hypothetical protein
MPKATSTYQERFELKSLEDGFVVIRRMSYGEKLERQQMAMKIAVNMGGKDATAAIDMAQLRVAEFEFPKCIVDHNLTNEDDQPLDFRKPTAIKMLDGVVGEEIAEYIGQVNNFELDGADPLRTSSES